MEPRVVRWWCRARQLAGQASGPVLQHRQCGSTDVERTLDARDKWLIATNGVIAVGLDTKMGESQ